MQTSLLTLFICIGISLFILLLLLLCISAIRLSLLAWSNQGRVVLKSTVGSFLRFFLVFAGFLFELFLLFSFVGTFFRDSLYKFLLTGFLSDFILLEEVALIFFLLLSLTKLLKIVCIDFLDLFVENSLFGAFFVNVAVVKL
jgi:hypothetical protein